MSHIDKASSMPGPCCMLQGTENGIGCLYVRLSMVSDAPNGCNLKQYRKSYVSTLKCSVSERRDVILISRDGDEGLQYYLSKEQSWESSESLDK